jgi:hypothetical protein
LVALPQWLAAAVVRPLVLAARRSRRRG